MSSSLRLVVQGAAGRMGQAVLRLAEREAGVTVVAGLVRNLPDATRLVGPLRTGLAEGEAFDALIDFSGVHGFDAALALALQHRCAFVSGSTGLSVEQQAALDAAAASIPVLWAANFSLGVAVLAHLASEAARLLDWDCEIIEAHHRHKLDAPSGTALMLGRRIAAARGLPESAEPVADRSGARAPGAIGYAVTRGGDVIGEHEVRLLGAGERIELCHRAGDRDLFAAGALRAARWLAGRPASRYGMTDVLGIGSIRDGARPD